jgi:AraC family transcriptional regulator
VNLHDFPDLNFQPIDHVDNARLFSTRSANGNGGVISHLSSAQPGPGECGSAGKPDVYTAIVHLSVYVGHDVWCDGSPIALPTQHAGALVIYDRRHDWRYRIENPFDCILFHFPRAAISDFPQGAGAGQADMFPGPVSFVPVDPVMHHLSLALLPVLARPDQANGLFVDHVFQTVLIHLSRTYGSSGFRRSPDREHLAPWQERCAKEYIATHLGGKLPLADVAAACRLSPSHFSRLFKQSTGMAPHQWLLDRRVERAKHLLMNTQETLTDIACAAGFADQSHLTRVFSKRVRVSPCAWRRANRG